MRDGRTILIALALTAACAGNLPNANSSDRSRAEGDQTGDATSSQTYTSHSDGGAPQPLSGRNLLGYAEARANCEIKKVASDVTLTCIPVKMLNGRAIIVDGYDSSEIASFGWGKPEVRIGESKYELPKNLNCQSATDQMKFLCPHFPIAKLDLGTVTVRLTVVSTKANESRQDDANVPFEFRKWFGQMAFGSYATSGIPAATGPESYSRTHLVSDSQGYVMASVSGLAVHLQGVRVYNPRSAMWSEMQEPFPPAHISEDQMTTPSDGGLLSPYGYTLLGAPSGHFIAAAAGNGNRRSGMQADAAGMRFARFDKRSESWGPMHTYSFGAGDMVLDLKLQADGTLLAVMKRSKQIVVAAAKVGSTDWQESVVVQDLETSLGRFVNFAESGGHCALFWFKPQAAGGQNEVGQIIAEVFTPSANGGSWQSLGAVSSQEITMPYSSTAVLDASGNVLLSWNAASQYAVRRISGTTSFEPVDISFIGTNAFLDAISINADGELTVIGKRYDTDTTSAIRARIPDLKANLEGEVILNDAKPGTVASLVSPMGTSSLAFLYNNQDQTGLSKLQLKVKRSPLGVKGWTESRILNLRADERLRSANVVSTEGNGLSAFTFVQTQCGIVDGMGSMSVCRGGEFRLSRFD